MDKRFDRILKAFADEAPLTLLRLLGIVPPGAKVKVTPLRPETAPAMVFPDYAAIVAVDSGEPFIFHIEFQLQYRAVVPARMARYGVSLAWQYGRRVVSVLLLLHPEGALAEIPEVGEYAIGRDSRNPSVPGNAPMGDRRSAGHRFAGPTPISVGDVDAAQRDPSAAVGGGAGPFGR